MSSSLRDVRDRMVPMMEVAAEQYRGRVPDGYPLIVDNVPGGTIGLEIDPSYALYITDAGDGLRLEMYRRNPRTDARATAGRQNYGGAPFDDQRPLPDNVDDQTLRNVIGELMNAFNMQPGLLYIVDD